MKLLSVLLAACLLTIASPLPTAAIPDLVILVRHAERAAELCETSFHRAFLLQPGTEPPRPAPGHRL